MSAMEPLCTWFGINSNEFAKEEKILIEAELFMRICEELKEVYKIHYKDYFRLMKCNTEMENAVMEVNYTRCVVNDILSTEEYTMPGIARYTQIPEEVIYDVATGLNSSPSVTFFWKMIELHRSVRRELYDMIIEKIKTKLDKPE